MPAPRFRLALILVTMAAGAAGACYNDPNKQLDQMQQTIDLQSTLEELQSRTSELQFGLDSLRGIVAKQDSTIARLANLAGVPYSR